MRRPTQSLALILTAALALPAAAAPAATLPTDPAERAQSCFYASVTYSRAQIGVQRSMVLQYFVYVAARAEYGAAVTLANLDAIATRMNDAAKVRAAAPLFSACQAAYPLSRGQGAVTLPTDAVQAYAICEANTRTLPNVATSVAKSADTEEEKQGGEVLTVRANMVEERLMGVRRQLVATGGQDQAGLTQKVDLAVGGLPEIGRPDRVFEACQKAYPR